jgi:2-methylcitrate dehydratase PrpD
MKSKYRKPQTFDPPGITRRNLFEWAGLAFTAAAVCAPPLGAFSSSEQSTPPKSGGSVMDALSTYMSEAANRPLPDEVVEKTKHHILDTLGAMVSGSKLLPGQRALQFVQAYGGREISTVVASNVVCGPIEAALTNGMLAHADETDDSHSPSQSHPGCAVVPAALAAGEQFQISGTHLLRAVALGYDIGTRVTMTLGGQKFEVESHWSTHSIAPNFGAAAAAACTANLNGQEMRWMLGYTGHQSSGLGSWNRDPDHIQKAFLFAGMNARSGVTSALVVKSGWTGVDDIFSGKDNFFQAYNPNADPSGLIDKLGERYEITRTNIKKWPVGSPIQAALDALEILRKEHPFDASRVQQVKIRLATDEADKERLKDPAVLRERAKVTLIPDAQLESLMPLRVAILELTLTDGTQLRQRVDNVRGTPENPMSREEVLAKSRDLITPVLGEHKCVELISKVMGLENVRNIREFRPLLQLK